MRFEFTDEEIARMTAKKNARLRAKFPLLSYAGLLEEGTPAAARASWDAINKRWQETEARLVARAAEFCEQRRVSRRRRVAVGDDVLGGRRE